MLRGFKFALALVNLAVFAAIWIEPSGRCAAHLGFWARFQILPAVLALDVAVLVAQVVGALVFGRVYCAVLCPLGAWQDLVRRATFRRAGRTRRVCARLPETKAQIVVRSIVFVLFLAGGLATFLPNPPCGAGWGVLDPYGIFGRAAFCLRQPPADVAGWAAACGVFGGITLAAAVGHGRFWCNWICPVGSALQVLVRLARRLPWTSRLTEKPDCTCAACRRCACGVERKDAADGA